MKNSRKILQKWSNSKSIANLFQYRVSKSSDLIKLSGNRTSETKHLNDLKAAERLIFLTKNKKALIGINRILTTFQTNYDNR